MSMKFITSTDLKQWADTKECQQLLPELIKKLIDASVSDIDKLSFPSGDATFIPGWDGIVESEEKIDLVPSGISLWECGTTKDVKSKIDDDFKKRDENPLGYDKSLSTFVFVTPRIWEGAEEWKQNHGPGWKEVVIYTAVELERWIDNTPSVGMWLAEKLRKLPAGGYMCPETYWNRWAQGKSITLPYEIILPGREEVIGKVIEACKNKEALFLQALTQNEGIAFAIASLMTSKDADGLINRTIVVTDKNSYNDLVEHYDNLIILTTLTDHVHYTTSRGHAVIVATTPADHTGKAIKLPMIEKGRFVGTLVKLGIDEAKARKLATDTTRDINIFRRRWAIAEDTPKWTKSYSELLPAILVGKWNETCEGDKEILASLSGMEYEQYELKLQAHLSEEETPLIHVLNTWRIRSPYEAIQFLLNVNAISRSLLEKYRTICLNLIQDDDPKALEELNDNGFRFREFNQKYSNVVKEGVFQNLCLLSILDKSENGENQQWVDETISLMLNDWSLQRFLSNRSFLTSLAEASPNSFLSFIENLSQEMLDIVFKPQKQLVSLSDWKIYYTELLFSLEMLAWEEEYLNRVVRLLLRFSEYDNESNYENRPDNSLYNTFRLYWPQTHVVFDNRMTILKACSTLNKKAVFKLCIRILDPMNTVLHSNHYYKWRLFGELEHPHDVKLASAAEINSVKEIMLQCCNYSAKEVSKLIELSSNVNMGIIRGSIFDAIKQQMPKLKDTQIIVDTLRKEITRHRQCEGADWALTKNELFPYQELLNELEPQDVLQKNAWFFEDYYVQLPSKRHYDTKRIIQERDEIRLNALKEIVEERGEDGLWDFIRMVKCPESLSKSIVTFFDDKLNDDICQKYKSGTISDSFTKSYLSALCNKDISKYVSWAENVVTSDQEMSIVLYGPGYVKELADIADKLGAAIKRNYWESIHIGFYTTENIEEIVRELINVNRYSEAIKIISSNREAIQITEKEMAQLLNDYFTKGHAQNGRLDLYNITSVLEELDKSDDPNVISLLINLEFFLYKDIEHHMDTSKLRFTKELSRNPELMIQLVEMAFHPDDNVEQLEEDESSRRFRAECALHILYFGHNIISFNNEDGVFDGENMKKYIEQLYRLAKERKRTHVIDLIVGEILGGIPRGNDYPPVALCELVESLNNDTVDQSISRRIYNSRGVTLRAYNEGGNQERSIVSKFEGYKEKTKLQYPRMTEIFNHLIRVYKHEAGRLDDEALIADLEY